MEKNSFMLGFAVAAMAPILGFFAINGIFDMLANANIIEGASGYGMAQRERTIYLLSICIILIPFNIFNRKRWTDSMRGTVIPFLIYIGFWAYKYQDVLFSQFG